VFRFILGYITLFAIRPRVKTPKNLREELSLFLAGFFGVTLYMFLQNIALRFTSAANVSLITSAAPLLTAWLFAVIYREKPSKRFLIGFCVAISGIFLIVYEDSGDSGLLGDAFALLASASWAAYGAAMKNALSNGDVIETNRRVFFYGIITMLPMTVAFRTPLSLAPLKNPVITLNLLYLSVLSSAACFVTWSKAGEFLGVVKASSYLYLTPVVTIITSFIAFGEKITYLAAAGAILVLLGLYISDKKTKRRKPLAH
jgi:drug/metabolite transporter (DMT)-like permease